MSIQEMFSIIAGGGWVMILLAILALILYGAAFELMFFTFSGNLNSKSEKNWEEWINNPESSEGRVKDIIKYTQQGQLKPESIQRRFEEIHFKIITRVERRLIYLNTLVAAAPLAGLLGTVIGMLSTFDGIANSARGETMTKVAGGIHEALLTTQTGLMIALPGVFFGLIILRKKKALEASIARLESLTLLNKVGVDDIDSDEEDIMVEFKELTPVQSNQINQGPDSLNPSFVGGAGDFIDQKLNGDINVTSPTGLKTYFDLSGINLAKTFWKKLKA